MDKKTFCCGDRVVLTHLGGVVRNPSSQLQRLVRVTGPAQTPVTWATYKITGVTKKHFKHRGSSETYTIIYFVLDNSIVVKGLGCLKKAEDSEEKAWSPQLNELVILRKSQPGVVVGIRDRPSPFDGPLYSIQVNRMKICHATLDALSPVPPVPPHPFNSATELERLAARHGTLPKPSNCHSVPLDEFVEALNNVLPKPLEETEMEEKKVPYYEERTYVGGVEVGQCSDEFLLQMIREVKAEINDLQHVGVESEYVSHKITQLEADQAKIVSLLDARVKKGGCCRE